MTERELQAIAAAGPMPDEPHDAFMARLLVSVNEHQAEPNLPSPALSENTSEKRGRGRPRLSSPLWDHVATGYLGAKDKTRRTQTSRWHAQRAATVILAAMPEAEDWINSGPWTILAELGRIADDEQLVDMARFVIESGLTARKAIAACRRLREARRKKASALDLANEIIRTVNHYFDRHPETTDQQVQDALCTVWGKTERKAEGEQ